MGGGQRRSRARCPEIRGDLPGLVPWLLLLAVVGAPPAEGQRRLNTAATSVTTTPPDADRSPEGRLIYTAKLLDGRIEVDGDLTDEGWGNAPIVPLPFETSPGNNVAAPVATQCMVTYDDRNLYLGCKAYDPDPGAVRAYVTDRDDIDSHDRIVLTIDPFNDARRAFQFGINPLGVQYDAVFAPGTQEAGGMNNRGPADPSWDAIWASSGRLVAEGYIVEAAIPFESLRFPSADGIQTWGFYVSRSWPRSDDVEMRSMTWDRDSSCELCQANLLTGLESIEPGANMQFTPTFTSARTDTRGTGGGLEAGEVDPQFGMDARWGITTDLSLNATVNPDFSQIEADVAQLAVNNRFALFFPEKRPFFLEGAELFNTPIQALFTRSIADPSFGTKLTGKSGGRSFGVLVARDEVNNVLLPGPQSSSAASLDEQVYTTSGRFRQDVGASSNVGALYVGREGEDGYYNRVMGADAFLRVLPALTARLQFLRSETQYGDAFAEEYRQARGRFGGNALTAQLRYSTRNWFAAMNASQRGAGFRADAGFVPQADWRDLGAWFDRTFWKDDSSWVTSFMVSGGFWHQEDTQGQLLQGGVWTNLQYNGPLQSTLWINPNIGRENLSGVDYTGLKRMWFGGSIRPTGSVGFRFNASVRETVDLTNDRLGQVFHISPSLDLRLGRHVDLRLSQSWFDMNTPEGEDVFTAGVSQLRAVYNFSPRSFFRAIVQYRDTDRVPALHLDDVDRSSSSLFTQFLFSYKVNPQTVLFLGYTDNRSGHVDLEFNQHGLTQLDRTFFLKLGYAFRP